MKFLSDFLFASILFDAPEHYQFYFQDAASSLGEEIIWFHDRLLFYFVLIAIVVLWMITQIVLSFRPKIGEITERFIVYCHTICDVVGIKSNICENKESIPRINVNNRRRDNHFIPYILIFALVIISLKDPVSCLPYEYVRSFPIPVMLETASFSPEGPSYAYFILESTPTVAEGCYIISNWQDMSTVLNSEFLMDCPLNFYIGLDVNNKCIILRAFSHTSIDHNTLVTIHNRLLFQWLIDTFVGFDAFENNYKNNLIFIQGLRKIHVRILSQIAEDILNSL